MYKMNRMRKTKHWQRSLENTNIFGEGRGSGAGWSRGRVGHAGDEWPEKISGILEWFHLSLLHEYLLSTYYVMGTVLDVQYQVASKIDTISVSQSSTLEGGDR